MNLKHLIILIVIVLIVLVSYLILTKRDQFYFHGDINCADIGDNETVCLAHGGNCVVKKDSNDNVICQDKCRFYPVSADESNYEDFKMTRGGQEGNYEYFFENEEQNGIFSECFNQCRNINRNNDILKSICDTGDCQARCQNYLQSRVDKISSADIKFKPYPTNRLEQVDYNTLKDTIVTQMVGDFKKDIQDTIFQDSINTELSTQVDLEDESTKLNNVISVLKNLNSTGNNFIQQVDQLGEFQDKYSQKIEELLDEKKNTNTNLDMKIDSIQNKLEELNKYYTQFNTNVNTNKQNSINKIYKSVSCLANGISINLVPINYKVADGKYENYRNGVYALHLNIDATDSGVLFVEPKKEDPNDATKQIYCNPYDSGCSYILSIQPQERENETPTVNADNILEIDISDSGSLENIASVKYQDKDVYSPIDFQFKRQAYFNVREIKTNEEYNSILITTPMGSKNLITNEQIKYPFFVIESLEMPGYLVNISKGSDASTYKIMLKPANKGGTEKFKVSSNTHSEPDKCSV